MPERREESRQPPLSFPQELSGGHAAAQKTRQKAKDVADGRRCKLGHRTADYCVGTFKELSRSVESSPLL